MTKVIADITVSVDGYVTGPAPDLEHGLGHGGEALHIWAVDSDSEVDAEVLASATEATGAVVMGRRLFDFVDGPYGWNEEMAYGAGLAATPPVIVVTHSAPAVTRLGSRFSFVTDGLAAAISAARAAAGGKDVFVMGGADVVRQSVDLGLADELRLHLAPVILGAGTPLFEGGGPRELTQISVKISPNATHLTYAVGKPPRPAASAGGG